MSMVKSAVRMRLASIGSFEDGLPPLNEVLYDLTSDASYVTFAYITGDGNRQLTFSLGRASCLSFTAGISASASNATP